MSARASDVIPFPLPVGAGGAEAALECATVPIGSTLPPAWLHAHVSTLWRIVARLGVPAHQIEDVLQDTYITAARRRADIEEGRERAFLIATATRLCSNYRKRVHVRREVVDREGMERHASSDPDPEGLLVRKRLRERLERALDSLSDEHRTVFVLYELEGLSIPEIADVLKLPVGTATSRLGRARAKFARAATRIERGGGPLEEP